MAHRANQGNTYFVIRAQLRLLRTPPAAKDGHALETMLVRGVHLNDWVWQIKLGCVAGKCESSSRTGTITITNRYELQTKKQPISEAQPPLNGLQLPTGQSGHANHQI
jgi:hypothetical protein